MAVRNGGDPGIGRRTLAATVIKNRFGQVLNEIRRTGGPIIVERGGKAVAVILSIELFERLRPSRKRERVRRTLALAAFGMWADRSDLDDAWLNRGRAHWRSVWKRG